LRDRSSEPIPDPYNIGRGVGREGTTVVRTLRRTLGESVDTSQPGPLMMLVGGILMAIGTLLDWQKFGSGIGLSLDTFGLLGIFALLTGLALAAVGAIRAFGLSVALPEQILGFTLMQLLMIDAFAVFLWTFSHIASDFFGGGMHLTWIGAVVAAVGAGLASKSATADAS